MENKIANGMREWDERAKRMQQLFGPELASNPSFWASKLAHYKVIVRNVQPLDKNGDEAVSCILLRSEIRKMEKELIPSLGIRVFKRVLEFARNFKKAGTLNPAVQNGNPGPKTKPLQLNAARRDIIPLLKKAKPETKLLEKKRTRQRKGLKQ